MEAFTVIYIMHPFVVEQLLKRLDRGSVEGLQRNNEHCDVITNVNSSCKQWRHRGLTTQITDSRANALLMETFKYSQMCWLIVCFKHLKNDYL